jgi:hypothetical protein
MDGSEAQVSAVLVVDLMTAAGVEQRDGRWYVERSFTYREPESESGKIPIRPFIGSPAYVKYQYGVTINMGDYNSARVEVSLSMPCYVAEVDQTAEAVARWVGDRCIKEQAELAEEAKRRREHVAG